MMEAVARGKAASLLRQHQDDATLHGRRPQEDLVTSELFGLIGVLPADDQPHALRMLVGSEAWKALGGNGPVQVRLWPRLTGVDSRRHVEPDVLILRSSRSLIVEVKWFATLSHDQLRWQYDAVARDDSLPTPAAVLLLGQSVLAAEQRVDGIPSLARSWQDVTVDTRQGQPNASAPLKAWCDLAHRFLDATMNGHIYGGLPAGLRAVPSSTYSFIRADEIYNGLPDTLVPVPQTSYIFTSKETFDA